MYDLNPSVAASMEVLLAHSHGGKPSTVLTISAEWILHYGTAQLTGSATAVKYPLTCNDFKQTHGSKS